MSSCPTKSSKRAGLARSAKGAARSGLLGLGGSVGGTGALKRKRERELIQGFPSILLKR